MIDPNHIRIVQEALSHDLECPDPQPPFLFGELILFHTLLQDFGMLFLEEDQFIPIMERNKKRIEKGPIDERS